MRTRYRCQLRRSNEPEEDPEERWSDEQIEAEVARVEASGMLGFRLDLFAELEDGRRLGDGQYATRSFSLLPSLPSLAVVAPADAGDQVPPSVKERVREAAGRALRRTGDPRAEGGHLATLLRSLREVGVDVPVSELASAPVVFEFDEVARRQMTW
jgi:hypothetical protein